jgi:endonuclease YncB( thermonuclease family)
MTAIPGAGEYREGTQASAITAAPTPSGLLTPYVYWATVLSVHDADTLVMDWDLGRRTWARSQHFRLAGISARELHQDGGPQARDAVAALLPVGMQVLVRSVKVDHDPADDMSFERYVISLILSDGRDLAAHLVDEGWAVRWDGRSRPVPYPPWPRIVP